MSRPEKISIDGVDYVRSDLQPKTAESTDGLPYVIVRADRAGVFAGYLKSRTPTPAGVEVELVECRRLWYWSGAASCSEIADSGVSKPDECRFPVAVRLARISGVIEEIHATESARASIMAVNVWSGK